MFLRESMARGEVAADVDVEELSLATAMLMDGVIAHHAENGDRFDADLVQRSVNALLDPVMRALRTSGSIESLDGAQRCGPARSAGDDASTPPP